MKRITLKNSVMGVLLIMALLVPLACQAKVEPLRVGVVGTMTGTNSDLTISGRRGVELAAEQANQNGGVGGRLVELVIKDDQNNVSTAQKTDEAFVADQVPFVIGHFTSGMIVGNMDYIRKQKNLYLGATISADELSGIDDNFIRFIASTKALRLTLNRPCLEIRERFY